MISNVNHIDNVSAALRIAGGGLLRRDGEHPRPSHEESPTLDQERRETGEHGQEPPERSAPEGRGGRESGSRAAHETGAVSPPKAPGLVMAHQLAGNGKSDAALGRLLDDLGGINSPAPDDESAQESAPPVAPFAHSNRIGGPFDHAASAYEWGHQSLNSADTLKPGAVFSKQF